MKNTHEVLEKLKSFDIALKETNLYPLTSSGIKVFQINMGKLCNQACRHCHVEAGPDKKEIMTKETMEMCLEALRKGRYPVVDITGGAPEMNPDYRWFVKECRELGRTIKTRTNLTILTENGYSDMPDFFKDNKVEIAASLPYYLESTTDTQRGGGVFKKSIEVLKMLNRVGYGIEGTGLTLNLVYNPCGAYLPPSQKSLEMDFKRELKRRYGISFNSLFTITNMPIGRFFKFLRDSNNFVQYTERLQSSYNPAAAVSVMCREIVSIGWDGGIYDCDFNQMLGIRCNHGAPDHLRSFEPAQLDKRRIVTGFHCYGCTAGAGSSCTGAMA